MISKKKMREKVIDVFNGAGLIWQEDDCYFEEFSLENLGNAITALERTFNLPADTRLRTPWRLKDFNEVESTVNLIREAIEYDT